MSQKLSFGKVITPDSILVHIDHLELVAISLELLMGRVYSCSLLYILLTREKSRGTSTSNELSPSVSSGDTHNREPISMSIGMDISRLHLKSYFLRQHPSPFLLATYNSSEMRTRILFLPRYALHVAYSGHSSADQLPLKRWCRSVNPRQRKSPEGLL